MDIIEHPGYITSLQITLPYQSDPLALYRRLCQHHAHNLLLDSAEINSRENLKSLLMVDAALQIVCNDQTVDITALTNNGEQLLPWLAEQLAAHAELTREVNKLTCVFERPDTDADEDSRLRATSNIEPLRIIQQQLQQTQPHPLGIFLGGVFGYDYIASFEQLPDVAEGVNCCPDYHFYLAETLIIIDHQQQTTELLANLFSGPDSADFYPYIADQVGRIVAQCQLPCRLEPASAPSAEFDTEVTATPTASDFATIVTELQQHILAGDIFQVVPSRRFELNCNDALAAYQRLKVANPSPYMFFMRTDSFELFGASPESALKYTAATNQVELYPIAGTRPRGKDADGNYHPDLDSRLELELRLDQKELAEHMMLVDLARNDLSRIARAGTRYVADLLQVDRYSHVMHLVSRVVAQLADDLDALHAYRACMNMGTLVGAPKVSAATLIRQVEQQRRGSYGGAVGYLSGNGDMDSCIVIRSAFVRNGRAVVQAGAGVVHDSIPAAEVAETESKARAVIKAIQDAQRSTEAAS
ncbi:anthranilate synthase component 1 [Pseudidiomarina sp.]|uniref:anthranilate synthase component 1 n=1 Tax=Pseudidiomarina sp. TaxID=2081707 RepID=UPI00299E2709|nr:anthranilate synthase component 1 [Pseudidiomarina sp.]MDX1706767.1 anthranilate synthase component 1 [Pseudidiomarina sp.]